MSPSDSTSAPLISVIIPARNGAEFVNEAVENVMQQTLKSVEIVITDDGSDEKTIAAYRLPPNARLLRHETGRGAAAARNTAIYASVGKYIAPLDQDDLWAPDKLEKQVAVLESNPDVALVFTHCMAVDRDRRPLGQPWKVRRSARNALWRLLRGTFITTPSSILVRRDAMFEVGLFDEESPRAMDWEFYLRLARRYRFAAIPESLTLYRMHPGQIHRNQDVMYYAKLRIYEKTLAWAREERPFLVPRVRQCYARVLRQRARWRLMDENDPQGAVETLHRAIDMWPLNLQGYVMLARARRIASLALTADR